MSLFCGIDWGERQHDVAVVDDAGVVRARARIGNDACGLQALLALLADLGDSPAAAIRVAIETPRGLLVACLRGTGRPVFAVNPLAVSRYRDRHAVAGAKSDRGDALVLAHLLRTDMAQHRPLPADSEHAQAVAVLARAQQDAVWDRQQLVNRVRCLLLEYFPAALEAFAGCSHGGLARADARAVLAAAPTPTLAAALTPSRLRAVLVRAGRTRRMDPAVERLRRIFAAAQMRHLPAVEAAMGRQLQALVGQLDAACTAETELATAIEDVFGSHPHARVLTSFPGVGTIIGARLLGEIGDDPTRFSDARALKRYAGAAPITKASGRMKTVRVRRVKNQRLAATGYVWAFAALRPSPGARRHYDARRRHGDTHTAALRHLWNRLLGCLHHCLRTHRTYQEHEAFPQTESHTTTAA